MSVVCSRANGSKVSGGASLAARFACDQRSSGGRWKPEEKDDASHRLMGDTPPLQPLSVGLAGKRDSPYRIVDRGPIGLARWRTQH